MTVVTVPMAFQDGGDREQANRIVVKLVDDLRQQDPDAHIDWDYGNDNEFAVVYDLDKVKGSA